jgi:hypothetical protein
MNTDKPDTPHIIDATPGEHITDILVRGFFHAAKVNRTVLVRHNDRIISIGIVST